MDDNEAPKTPVAVIDAAKALLTKGWCKGCEAVDSNDKAVFASDADARQFCIIGAVARALGARSSLDASEDPLICGVSRFLEDRVHDRRGFAHVVDFNDDEKTELADVLAFLDEARDDVPLFYQRHVYEPV